jgi:hypothetical protein
MPTGHIPTRPILTASIPMRLARTSSSSERTAIIGMAIGTTDTSTTMGLGLTTTMGLGFMAKITSPGGAVSPRIIRRARLVRLREPPSRRGRRHACRDDDDAHPRGLLPAAASAAISKVECSAALGVASRTRSPVAASQPPRALGEGGLALLGRCEGPGPEKRRPRRLSIPRGAIQRDLGVRDGTPSRSVDPGRWLAASLFVARETRV